MPIRPRELNDQTTHARLREVIRYMVNQEIQRMVRTTSGPIEGRGGGSGGTTITETVLNFSAQVWELTVPEPPLLTTWDADTYVPGGGYNTFSFNAKVFNDTTPVFAEGAPTVSYDVSTTTLSIDWGSTKTGTVSTLAYGSVGYGVIAVAES